MKDSAGVVSVAEEEVLFQMISRHNNEHPSLCGGKPASLLTAESQAEVQQLLCEDRHEPLRTYLLVNWYNDESMMKWGRRNGQTGIPFARTTMFVESHWSTLKRTFLKFHNRPRPDFLLFLFDRRLIPKFKADYDLIVEGAKKPCWYKWFVRDWKKMMRQVCNQNSIYDTNKTLWLCRCPTYLLNRFFLCKHLIDGAPPPQCRDVIRRRTPPFFLSRRDPGRKYPLIGQEGHAFVYAGDGLSCEDEERTPQDVETVDLREGPRRSSRYTTQVREVLSWINEHVTVLAENEAGEKQIEYIHDNVLKNLLTYRRNVLRNIAARNRPTTWGVRDNLFLP